MLFSFLGTTEEVTTCSHCGRTRLKMTVVLTDNTTQELVYLGTTCAARALGWIAKRVKGRIAAFNERQKIRRDNVRYIKSAPWGQQFIEEFRAYYKAGNIIWYEPDRTWRFSNRTTFTYIFTSYARWAGIKLPKDVGCFVDFDPKELLE